MSLSSSQRKVAPTCLPDWTAARQAAVLTTATWDAQIGGSGEGGGRRHQFRLQWMIEDSVLAAGMVIFGRQSSLRCHYAGRRVGDYPPLPVLLNAPQSGLAQGAD